METAPDELNNLAVNPEYQGLLTKLRRKAVEEFREKSPSSVWDASVAIHVIPSLPRDLRLILWACSRFSY